MTLSSLFFNETFSSLVLSKPWASSVINGTSVLVNEFDIVIVIEELVPLKIVTKWCVINLRSWLAMFVMGENRFHRTHDCIWLSLANESFLVENSSSLEGERGVLVVMVAQLLRGYEVIIKVAALAERGEFSLTHELFSLGMSSFSCLARGWKKILILKVGRTISSVLSETLVQSRAKRFPSSVSSKMSALSVPLSRARRWLHQSPGFFNYLPRQDVGFIGLERDRTT
ncbi:hypothetical protein DY000_02025746 [Brassica cretica]|uniref:Uncharacterized protein n=1 Tax=Brassica cretica TaxID=69181 RepID=A0ABQ7EIP4_BRACR|nr:hypothetical protein DY000_02025746 [Brassica cretica]